MNSALGPIRDLRVLIDTCSLMKACEQFGPAAMDFFKKHLSDAVRESGAAVIVPREVGRELERNKDRLPNERTRQAAADALALVADLCRDGLFQIRGEVGDSFPDNLFQQIIIQHCERHAFCLITEDRALAADVLDLAQRRSVSRARPIAVVRIGRANLERWEQKRSGWVKPVKFSQSSPAPTGQGQPPMKFRVVQGRARVLPALLTVSTTLPGENDRIYDEQGHAHLLHTPLGGGGEGRVFLTDSGLACKIYDRSRLTEGLKKKLELMRHAQLSNPGLCWPRTLAVNNHGEFVGYLMDRAAGRELQKALFIKPLFQKCFPGWTRLQLTALVIRILELIVALHARGVILGDINPLNILVADERSVYFVDTDSYQIEAFPCPVGTPTFLAADLAGQDLGTVLRTFAHESFAVSTLVFMLLMPGKPPYSHAGGGDPAENVRQRHFPYNLGDKRGVAVPDGPWRFIWSHFPFYLKQKFHEVFNGGDRPQADTWLKVMERYRSDLASGNLPTTEIFPSGFKRLSRRQVELHGGSWLTCAQCGLEYGEMRALAAGVLPLCADCRARPDTVQCYLCDATFQSSASDTLRHRHRVCKQCRTTAMSVICVDCHKSFDIQVGERVYFKENALTPPKRCETCRRAKKVYGAPTARPPMLPRVVPPYRPAANRPGGFWKWLFGG
jgi:hypothetical protein